MKKTLISFFLLILLSTNSYSAGTSSSSDSNSTDYSKAVKLVKSAKKYERTVVVRFPDYENAINWYNSNEYSPIKEIRKINSEGNAIIVDGI